LSALSSPTTALRKTALNETHRKMGAHMVPFGGWDMPLEYSGIVAEHMAVRTAVGLFDVSHMGEIEINGQDALRLIQKVTCNDASRLAVNQAQYSGLMNDRGGLVDDLLVHKLADDHYLLCVNASRREADFAWITRHNETSAAVRNTSDDYTQLALQGPRARQVLQPLTTVDLGSLKYYWFAHGKVCGTESLVARTGYTGEDGFEIYLPVSESERLWSALLDAGKQEGILPCGLGARNTLRLEAGMLLYGHDMNEDTTPFEANLGWITKLEKGPFLGSDILKRQSQEGVRKRLVGFEMIDRGIARDDAPVWVDEREVGKVTSGSYVPFLKRAIGLAYVPSELVNPGQRIQVEIRGNKVAAQVVKSPIYKRAKI
jgi:glycine cleavage system T protein (aminomethyltransferase)